MKIVQSTPPNALITRIEHAGMKVDLRNTIFTYEDTIYNPSGSQLPNHLIEHESVHSHQQAITIGGAEMWWAAYLADPMFRLEQEAEAYGHQYAVYCKNKKGQLSRLKFLAAISGMLSGQTYGGTISPQDALKLIQSKANKEL